MRPKLGRIFSIAIVVRSANRCKAALAGNDHIVHAAGAMDDLNIACRITAADDTNMTVVRVEYQIAGLSLLPCDVLTIDMLGGNASAVTHNIGTTGNIVKYPIHKAGAIQTIRADRSCGRAASCPYFHRLPPPAVPANDQTLAAPEIIDFAYQSQGLPDNSLAGFGNIPG